MILVGAGGLAKSRSVRPVLNGKACWIEGNATPFGMYVKLYQHRDQFVVIDDVDALYADRSGMRLLKCLCQTEEEKSVAWHSDARSLERQGIPREFTTKKAGSSSSPTTGRPLTRTSRRYAVPALIAALKENDVQLRGGGGPTRHGCALAQRDSASTPPRV